jgi:hypothetical protein
MLNKTQKNKLIKVCKVLFPKYKHVSVNVITKEVTFRKCSTPILRWFSHKWRVTLTELVKFQIPSQLADFKYGNKTFVSVIQEDLVRCDLAKANEIDYFLDEITKIKCADMYKKFNIAPVKVKTIVPTDEDLLFIEMEDYFIHEAPVKRRTLKSYWVSSEALFYMLLLIIVTYSLIMNLIPR